MNGRVRYCSLVLAGAILAASNPAQAQRGEPMAPPEAEYDISLRRSIMVPMRDGVELSTDLYFPEGAGDKLPVVLMRTAYNKNAYWETERGAPYVFAGQGHVVAVQDKRGRYESYKSQYSVYGGDDTDGYDTVDWLARQPWANGKVGTYGCSYLGDVQMMQARHRNPQLAAMVPQDSGGSLGYVDGRYRYGSFVSGGALELAYGFTWLWSSGNKIYYGPPDRIDASEWFATEAARYFDPAPTLPEMDYEEAWATLPLVDMVRAHDGPLTDWEDLVSSGMTDPYWDQFGYLGDDDRFDVPALFINSWYDAGARDLFHEFDLLSRNAESARARDNQFIITSPTTHCGEEEATEQTIVGARDLGDARKDLWKIYVDWFDHWLKGIDNKVTEMPKVQYYLMGKNEWRSADEWPLPNTRFTTYYLHSDGRANSRYGTGSLSTMAPGDEPPDSYRYDPATPVPSKGGNMCCTWRTRLAAGSFDQSDTEMRQDVLVYSSHVLQEGIEVTGPIEALLYVSSSAKDTDFTAKLVDVYPDGKAYNVQEGIFRARYREGFDKKVWMSLGEVYEIEIDLQATSNYFGPGHRIRLEVSSSNFPRFDRNLNTGGNNYDEAEWEVAANTVHHSGKHASHIVLPVVPLP